MRLSKQAKPSSYGRPQESLALLKLLAQSQRSIEGGRHKPVKKAFADLAARARSLP